MADLGPSGGSYFGQKKGGALALLWTVWFVGPAAAVPLRLSCAFDVECVGTEDCAESAFTMEIDWARAGASDGDMSDHAAPPAPARAQVTTDAESFVMVADLRADVLAFGRVTEAGDWWMLTVAGDVARLSIHKPASDLALYYEGMCQEVTL